METVTGLNWHCDVTLFTNKTTDSSLPSHRHIFSLLFCNCVSFVDVSITYVRKLTLAPELGDVSALQNPPAAALLHPFLLYAGGHSESLLPPEAAGGLAQKSPRTDAVRIWILCINSLANGNTAQIKTSCIHDRHLLVLPLRGSVKAPHLQFTHKKCS